MLFIDTSFSRNVVGRRLSTRKDKTDLHELLSECFPKSEQDDKLKSDE